MQEARERVRSALRNSGFELPSRRITVNLAPADVPKDGTAYDVAIAVGILAASGQLPDLSRLDDTALLGELALDGSVRPVNGCCRSWPRRRSAGIGSVTVVAIGDEAEAACVAGIAVLPAPRLGDVVAHLAGVRELTARRCDACAAWQAARRGAGSWRRHRPGHSQAGAGDRGGGASQPGGLRPARGRARPCCCAARRACSHPLEDAEAIEVSRIYSAAGLLDRRRPLIRQRPFRAPHHTVSTQGLVGGGPRVRPGEASLAHRGILFLDEALEFRTDALDALRQPLEAGAVTIARVEGALMLPARFTLLMAFNPCPCGWLTSASRRCRCDDGQARRYAGRLSGPMRDRLDLWVRADEPRHADPDGGRAERGGGAADSNCLAAAARAAGHGQRRAVGHRAGTPAWRSTPICERFSSDAAPSSGSRRGGCTVLPDWLAPSPTSTPSTTSAPEHVDEALHYRPETAA